jgi:hypothetical protein
MIDNQAKLTGLRPKSELTGLKVNTSVSNTSNTNINTNIANTVNQDIINHQIDINNLPNGETNNNSSLQKNDSLNKSTLISSGIAGGVAAFKTAQNVGAIGESMRIQTVQNAVNEIEMRTNANNSRGFFGRNNNYYDSNRYGYNSYDDYADYGSMEMMRRRYSPRLEYFNEQNRSYEMNLAMKNIASGTLQGAKYGTIIGGAVSSVVNAYNVITGKASGKEAVGTVAADTVTAGISGASGALTGGFASLGLGMIGMGGIPGLIVASGVGLAGAVGAQFLLQKTGIYNSIKEKVMNMMGGNK